MVSFKDKVIQIVRMIPVGKVASYGQVSLYCGLPRAAREVGWTLKATEEDLPWWRVVNNSGRISIDGNWNADKPTQKKLLEGEGVIVNEDFTFDIKEYRWKISEEEVKKLQLPDEIIDRIIEKYSL